MHSGKNLQKHLKHRSAGLLIRILGLHRGSIAPTSANSFPFPDGT